MIDQAGQLDRRITLQTFSEATDAFGQEVKSYSTLATVWAKVVEKIGTGNGEKEEGDMIAATKKVEFMIRYRTDVNEEMRISYNSNIYKIKAIQSADARKAFLKIVCLWSDAQ